MENQENLELFETEKPLLMSPKEVMAAAIEKYNPVKIFALFSSGNDSLCSTHFAMNHGATEALLCNTGFGIRQSREHWFATCCRHKWNCRMVFPPDKSYRDFVLQYGFPGPSAHRYAYVWLKERALLKVIQENKKDRLDRVMLVTGVRNKESARRMGFVQPIVRKGAAVWVAPMYNFSALDVSRYIEENSLIKSPVADLIHMSGECMCGAFANGDATPKDAEFRELEMWFPEMAEEIKKLQVEAESLGVHCKWGRKPIKENLTQEFSFMPMCVGCEMKT